MSPIPQDQPDAPEETGVIDIPVPGEPGYDVIEIIVREIEMVLVKKEVTNSQSIAIVAALMANSIIQTLPHYPCALLPAVGDVVHDQIHHQLQPGDGFRQ